MTGLQKQAPSTGLKAEAARGCLVSSARFSGLACLGRSFMAAPAPCVAPTAVGVLGRTHPRRAPHLLQLALTVPHPRCASPTTAGDDGFANRCLSARPLLTLGRPAASTLISARACLDSHLPRSSLAPRGADITTASGSLAKRKG